MGSSQEIEVKNTQYPTISCKLFPRLKVYSVMEKNALVLKWAIDSLRYYLLGNNFFFLVTEQAPLRWLNTGKDTNPKIML